MELSVDRFTSDNEATLGLMRINGKFECFTLEDQFQTIKVNAETRIPAGEYAIILRKHGGFHKRYTDKFPNFHSGMLEIINVPGFTDVLIHIGNDDDDTAGCILVGRGVDRVNGTTTHTIIRSTTAYKHFYYKVIAAMNNGERVVLKVCDSDK